jgi:hypothetical protein
MTNRSATDRAARAEARRRARLAARGELDESTDDEEPVAPHEPARARLLQRLFPTAPPLPGKPDPVAGFTYQGALRPIVLIGWLLRRNPVAWIVPGIVWAVARAAIPIEPTIGFIATMLTFVSLVAAGWIGWQRPSLYGAAAAVLGFVVVVVYSFWFFAGLGASPSDATSPTDLAIGIASSGVLFAFIGFVSGWYGGYLRRRQTAVNRQVTGSRR